MDTREIAAEYRLSHWSQIIRDRHNSGESIRAWCRKNGIVEKTYYYWQRKLRETACRTLMDKPSSEAFGSDKALAPSGWAICKTAPDKSEEKILPIEIGRCRVLAGPDVDPEQLSRICKVLMSLC